MSLKRTTEITSRILLLAVLVAGLLAAGHVGAEAQAQPTVSVLFDRSEPAVNDPCAVGGSFVGVRLVIQRDLTAGPLTVELEVIAGAAGTDFEPFPTTVAFADGEASISIPIIPIQSGGGVLGVRVLPGGNYQVGDPGELIGTFTIVSCIPQTTTTAPPTSTTTTVADTEVEDLDVLPRTGADPNLLLAGAGALTTGAGLWAYRAGRRRDRPRRRPF